MRRVTYLSDWADAVPTASTVSYVRELAIACAVTNSCATGAGRHGEAHAFRAGGRVVRHFLDDWDGDESVVATVEGSDASGHRQITMVGSPDMPGLPGPSTDDAPDSNACATFLSTFADMVSEARPYDRETCDLELHARTLRDIGIVVASSRQMPHRIAGMRLIAAPVNGAYPHIRVEAGCRVSGASFQIEKRFLLTSASISEITAAFPHDFYLEAVSSISEDQVRIRPSRITAWLDFESLPLSETIRAHRNPALTGYADDFSMEAIE